MWRRAMGILLAIDMLDEYRIFTNLFSKGNPIVWGVTGWCVLLLYIIWVGYQLYKCYIEKYFELIHIRVVCTSEKERIRVQLDREKLVKEKRNREYEKKRRELEKELKELKELKNNLATNFNLILKNGKKVTEDIEELTRGIKCLEEEISELDEQMEAENEVSLDICEKLQEKVEKNEEKIKEARRKLKKKKKIFKRKMKKGKAVFGVILIILFEDRHNMFVTAQELQNTLAESFDLSEESQVKEPETEEPVSEDITPGDKEKNTEILHDTENALREHMDYNFILEDEQLNQAIDDDIENIIFLTGYSKDVTGYEVFLKDCRERKIIEILPEEDSENELNLDELLNEIAEGLEKPFLKKVNEGKIIQTQIEWEQSAPRSSELENIMNKRRQALEMEESIISRRTTYFLLANDYQRLGDECLIQGKDATQIYYNYGMSIYCCYCALGYERSGKDSYSDEKILNYVEARYKDIIDNVKMEIPAEKANNVEKIYSLLNMY